MADPAYIVDGVLTDGEAWVGIATTTLASDAASITFANPADGSSKDWSQFVDFFLVGYAKTTYTGAIYGWLKMNFNNDTGGNYTSQFLYGDGSSALGWRDTAGSFIWFPGQGSVSGQTNEFAASWTHMFDVNSGKYKQSISQRGADSNGDGYVSVASGTWKSQAAIEEIDFTAWGAGDLAAGTRIDMWGILPRMVA